MQCVEYPTCKGISSTRDALNFTRWNLKAGLPIPTVAGGHGIGCLREMQDHPLTYTLGQEFPSCILHRSLLNKSILAEWDSCEFFRLEVVGEKNVHLRQYRKHHHFKSICVLAHAVKRGSQASNPRLTKYVPC